MNNKDAYENNSRRDSPSAAVDTKVAAKEVKKNIASDEVVGKSDSRSFERKAAIENKEDQKNLEPAKTLVEFLTKFLAQKGKILSEDKKLFDSLKNDLIDPIKQNLVELFVEKDKDLKYCFGLCNFLLEGSKYSKNRIELLKYIERVVSGYSFLSGIRSNSVFQEWLQHSADSSNKLGFFENQFRRIRGADEKGNEKHFSDKQVGTLLCISAVWLYFNDAADFSALTRYLGQSAYREGGQIDYITESQAFSFAISMIISTKKKKFGYFLKKVIDDEKLLEQRIKELSGESAQKGARISVLDQKLEDSTEQAKELKGERNELSVRVELLEKEASKLQEQARHRNTHHEGSKEELRIKIRNILEGELKDVLVKAKKAHEKGKEDVVEYQIDDALHILEREIKRM